MQRWSERDVLFAEMDKYSLLSSAQEAKIMFVLYYYYCYVSFFPLNVRDIVKRN